MTTEELEDLLMDHFEKGSLSAPEETMFAKGVWWAVRTLQNSIDGHCTECCTGKMVKQGYVLPGGFQTYTCDRCSNEQTWP